MRSATRAALAVLGIGSLFAVHVAGCSIVLGGAGLVIDSATAQKPRAVPPERVVAIRKGQEVGVLLEGGKRVEGVMAGRARLGRAEYSAKYDAWRAAGPERARYPALGEGVELSFRDGRRASGAFAGFGFRSVLLETGVPDEPREHAFADFVALAAGDRRFEARALMDSAVARALPSRDALELTVRKDAVAGDPRASRSAPRRSSVTGAGTMQYRIPTDEAREITLYRRGHAALTGLLVGLAIDAATLAAFASWDGPFGGGGCEGTYYSAVPPDARGAAWDPRTGRAAPRAAH